MAVAGQDRCCRSPNKEHDRLRAGEHRRIGWSARIVPFFFLIAVILLSGLALAETHRVGAGEAINPILSSAMPGDTVVLEPGEYFENLKVDVPVVLTGEGRPHIRGGYQGTVVHIKAPGAVVRGLRISEAGTDLMQDMAGVMVEADDVTIDNNEILEPLHGIYVKGANRSAITRNRIVGRSDLIEEDRGNGIHVWNSRDNLIEDNEILTSRDGIYFSFADATTVRRNHIHHVRYGLHYMYSNENVFEDNLFEENVAGAALMYSTDIRFLRNVFARCRGFRSYGILYQSMEDTVAEHNLILDNSRGIFINNSSSSTLRFNDIVSNDLALQLNGDGIGNSMSANNFIHNLSDLLLDVGTVGIEWTDNEGGNYWSSYSGFDLDGDGIGDRPFTIQNVFQVLENDYPEVRFFLFSLAAQILEVAEKALPILALGRAQDEAPRMRSLEFDEVPWENAQKGYSRGSVPAALVYLLCTSILAVWLWRRGRQQHV